MGIIKKLGLGNTNSGGPVPMMDSRVLYLYVFLLCLIGPGWLPGQNPMLRPTQTRAVIVGISDYQNISDLNFADRDAQAFADYLQSPAGGSVPAENIRLLINEGATYPDMGQAIHWLRETSEEGDRAIIYFAGHGDVETETAMQMGYLLNYDASKTTYSFGGAYPLIFLENEIKTLSYLKKAEVILVVDACRAGKLAGDAVQGNFRTLESLSNPFAEEIKILSCQKNELSQEDARWGDGRGVFSYYLIDGLTGLADTNGDEEVDTREIRRYLDQTVVEDTNEEQNPQVLGPPNHSLVKVDLASLQQLQEQKAMRRRVEESMAMNREDPSSLELSDPDSAILQLYKEFNAAIKSNHLMFPPEGAAYTIFERIKGGAVMEQFLSTMESDLAVALMKAVQQAFINYLEAKTEELQQRWNYDEQYKYYPKFLEVATELLGPDDIMYEDLKMKQLYFEGLLLRLQGEIEENASFFEEALEKQQEVLRRDPTAAFAYNEMGLLYRRLKENERANPYFFKANQYSPTWVLPMTNLVANYIQLDKLDSALVIGRKALQLDPTFAPTYFNLALVYQEMEDWGQAKAYFKKAIQLDPNDPDAYYNVGYLFVFEENWDQAEVYFLKYAEKKLKEEAAIWSNLGYIAHMQNKTATALKYFEKAIRINPEFSDTYFNKGEYHLDNQQLDQSEKAFQNYLTKAPDDNNADGYFMLAAVAAQRGNSALALDRLQMAVEKGFKDFGQIAEKDYNYFKDLQSSRRFQQLIKSLKE